MRLIFKIPSPEQLTRWFDTVIPVRGTARISCIYQQRDYFRTFSLLFHGTQWRVTETWMTREDGRELELKLQGLELNMHSPSSDELPGRMPHQQPTYVLRFCVCFPRSCVQARLHTQDIGGLTVAKYSCLLSLSHKFAMPVLRLLHPFFSSWVYSAIICCLICKTSLYSAL